MPPDIVPELAKRVDWNRFGRRVMVAADGIIAWMTPSGPHEDYADASEETVRLAARLLGRRIKAKRGTRWKRPEDPENTGLEADASFYIGANAERWYAAAEKGGKAAEVFEAATPPDLVIEVEATHADRDKPDRYAVLGATEMWRAALRENGDRIEVEILDLQAPGGPRPVETSLTLAGLRHGPFAGSTRDGPPRSP